MHSFKWASITMPKSREKLMTPFQEYIQTDGRSDGRTGRQYFIKGHFWLPQGVQKALKRSYCLFADVNFHILWIILFILVFQKFGHFCQNFSYAIKNI